MGILSGAMQRLAHGFIGGTGAWKVPGDCKSLSIVYGEIHLQDTGHRKRRSDKGKQPAEFKSTPTLVQSDIFGH